MPKLNCLTAFWSQVSKAAVCKALGLRVEGSCRTTTSRCFSQRCWWWLCFVGLWFGLFARGCSARANASFPVPPDMGAAGATCREGRSKGKQPVCKGVLVPNSVFLIIIILIWISSSTSLHFKNFFFFKASYIQLTFLLGAALRIS